MELKIRLPNLAAYLSRGRGLHTIARIPANIPRSEPIRNPPPPSMPRVEKSKITAPQRTFRSALELNITAPMRTAVPEIIPRLAETRRRMLLWPSPKLMLGRALITIRYVVPNTLLGCRLLDAALTTPPRRRRVPLRNDRM
jgi:hypothetical protein